LRRRLKNARIHYQSIIRQQKAEPITSEAVLLIPAAYLPGAIPSALLIARFGSGIDIRAVGSGNVGAINTFKEVSVGAGLLVLLSDVIKGMLVMVAILAFDLAPEVAFSAALAVTIGHNFSVFLRFAGGKGFAVVFGLSLVVFPVLTVISLAALPVAWLISRSIVWSFLITFVVLNTLTVGTGQEAADVGLCLTLSLVVIATHLWRNRDAILEMLKRHDLIGIGKIEYLAQFRSGKPHSYTQSVQIIVDPDLT
jgi:glycerol-3-phosphate acyltransferase PlsY